MNAMETLNIILLITYIIVGVALIVALVYGIIILARLNKTVAIAKKRVLEVDRMISEIQAKVVGFEAWLRAFLVSLEIGEKIKEKFDKFAEK